MDCIVSGLCLLCVSVHGLVCLSLLRCFFNRNPVGAVSDQIDLHGLHVKEALERLRDILDCQESGTSTFYF